MLQAVYDIICASLKEIADDLDIPNGGGDRVFMTQTILSIAYTITAVSTNKVSFRYLLIYLSHIIRRRRAANVKG